MEFATTACDPAALITPTEQATHARMEVFMRDYMYVSAGAVVGANLRFFVARLAAKLASPSFPYGTLLINVTGSFILGFFLAWTTERVLADVKWRWLIAIGFCGSYTTFSSYAAETIAYLEQGNWLLFGVNILSNNVLCLIAVLSGAAIARAI